jgi:hypothetical protein
MTPNSHSSNRITLIRHGPWRKLKRDIIKDGFRSDYAYMCRNEDDPKFGLWFKSADGRKAVIRHDSVTIFEKEITNEAAALSTERISVDAQKSA